jgi:hypothetical protein
MHAGKRAVKSELKRTARSTTDDSASSGTCVLMVSLLWASCSPGAGEISVYSGHIFVRSVANSSDAYVHPTAINASVLSGAVLVGNLGDFALPLTGSVVDSVSSSVLRITMSHSEYHTLITALSLGSSVSTGFELHAGPGHAIALASYGMRIMMMM